MISVFGAKKLLNYHFHEGSARVQIKQLNGEINETAISD
jgi:hypothetical protein